MEQQIVLQVTQLWAGLSGGTQNSQNMPEQHEESATDIFNGIRRELDVILETESGKRLIDLIKRLAKKVFTFKGCLEIVARFFHLAKDSAKKLLSSPKVMIMIMITMLVIFLLCITALIVFITFSNLCTSRYSCFMGYNAVRNPWCYSH